MIALAGGPAAPWVSLAALAALSLAAVRSARTLHLRTTASCLGATARVTLAATDGTVLWLLLDGSAAVGELNRTEWAFTRRAARGWPDLERWRTQHIAVRALRWRRHLVLYEPDGALLLLAVRRARRMNQF